ncbi:MAG: Gfo/Idh/MocA family oxidoreductase [Planctomycetota bacterium]|nr:Gfo/Idh/MocA family oxidoreductase [Planctomycetota bacterium]
MNTTARTNHRTTPVGTARPLPHSHPARLVAAAARWIAIALAAVGLRASAEPPPSPQPTPRADALRIAIAGLVHGHVEGLLWQASRRDDIVLVGVYEPDRAIFDRFAAKYALSATLYHDSLDAMLDACNPEAVSVMGPISDHLASVEACAPRGIHLLLEKPLAFSASEAHRMEELAREHNVHVLTNFETSWYASVREAHRLVSSGERAPLRKMVFRHGHKGPKEIGCAPEFVGWLADPKQNGGGAIVDFGCYGAVLATWLMEGQRPTSVVASRSTLKPDVYPLVDDDATIVLTYPGATAIIQASWAWTHDTKEMDLFTERGSIHAGKWDELLTRDENAPPVAAKPAAKPAHLRDEWTYLREVVRGRRQVDPLSSLEYNVIVAEILDAARSNSEKPIAPASR